MSSKNKKEAFLKILWTVEPNEYFPHAHFTPKVLKAR